MKKILFLLCCVILSACSSMIPYKDQNLDYLQGIEKDPNAYRGQVVSFGGEVKGITEDTLRLRLVLKIEAPLYYYATGKGNSLSYEMLLITFNKRGMPAMTGIKKGNHVKVLARVSSYETRKNFAGKDIAVLHLIAFALSDHTRHKDFYRPETPEKQLYESWKEGRLFFEESAQEVISRYPVPTGQDLPVPIYVAPTPENTPSADAPEPEKGIVFDEEEPTFIVEPTAVEEPSSTSKNSSGDSTQPTALAETPADKLPEKTASETAPMEESPMTVSAPSESLATAETPEGTLSAAITEETKLEQPANLKKKTASSETQPTVLEQTTGVITPAEALPSSIDGN